MSITKFTFYLFERQPHKMVKHTQAIRRMLATNFLCVFDHSVGFVLKEWNLIALGLPELDTRVVLLIKLFLKTLKNSYENTKLRHRCSPVNFAKFLRTFYYIALWLATYVCCSSKKESILKISQNLPHKKIQFLKKINCCGTAQKSWNCMERHRREFSIMFRAVAFF